jgi:tetratricopeptide (TPR) repeat protein
MRRRGRGLAAVALAIAGLTAALSASLSAQEEQATPPGEQKTRQISTMSESVFKELAQAQKKAEESKYAEALRILDKLREKDLNGYERTQIWNVYAFVYHAQERYPEAINAFKKLLAEKEVDEALEANALYGLAMLYFVTEDWRNAITAVNNWASLGATPKAQAYDLLAEAHYQLKEYRQAIAPLRKSMQLKQAEGQRPPERSYLLLRSAYSELGENRQVADVLEELISLYPKERYWIQLAGAYGEVGDKKKQLTALDLAYLQGYLDTQQELLMMVGVLLNNDLPYRAGKVLEKGIEDGVCESTLDNWRLLSQAWTLAHEDRKAIPALTHAAKMSKDGELDIVLAQSYINLEEWEPAVKAIRAGIAKSGLRRPDQAYVMLGQVLFNLKSYQESRRAFERAQADSRSRKLAARWLSYIENELDRQARLRAALQE